jgi:hypothetical protein
MENTDLRPFRPDVTPGVTRRMVQNIWHRSERGTLEYSFSGVCWLASQVGNPINKDWDMHFPWL